MTTFLEHGTVRVTLPSGERRTYQLDATGHRILVTDTLSGAALFTIGRRGSGLGQFDVPLDIVLVSPTFDTSSGMQPAAGYWIAVADYGNARVQIFDLDGTLIDVLNGHDLDYGWRPCQLTWRAPFLQVNGVERTGCCVHLAAAMLAHLGAQLPNPNGRAGQPASHEGRH